MTVKQLIEILNTFPQDSLVVMSGDGEGNNFSPLEDIAKYRYVAKTTWRGDIYDTTCVDGTNEEKGVPAIVFWPTN